MSEAASQQRTVEEGVEPDGIDSSTLLMWGFVSVVVVVCVMLAAAGLFYNVKSQFDARRVVAPAYFDSEKVVSDQQGVLASYGAPASEGKPYKIPINRAKRLVLEELAAGQGN